MKKMQMKRYVGLALAFVMTLGLFAGFSNANFTVSAADKGKLLFSTKYSSSITAENTYDRYMVVLAQQGTLSLNITRDDNVSGLPDNSVDIKLLNVGGTILKSETSGFTLPYNGDIDLEAGTYYVEIIQRSGNVAYNRNI